MKDRNMELSAIVFPHCRITDQHLKRALSLGLPVAISQPWLMEDLPPGSSKDTVSSLLRVLRPPEDLKPGANLKRLLSEFYSWMRNNRDKGYLSFLASAQDLGSSDEKIWEIRQMIRNPEPPSDSKQDVALKWHLILHLAAEFEANWKEANSALSRLRKTEPPLSQALGQEGPKRGFLDDLPLLDEEPVIEDHQLKEILEAWLGLFGQYAKGQGLLVTFNPEVMNLIEDSHKKEMGDDKWSSLVYETRLEIPDLSSLSWEEFLEIRAKVLESAPRHPVRNILEELDNKDAPRLNSSRFKEEIEKYLPSESLPGKLEITVRRLPHISEDPRSHTHTISSLLSGKRTALIRRGAEQ